ncbi:VapE domain-containing protein [Rhizobium wenxiniae]|uniref:VapE domain-containing protein n=1 Tax=Rhizobium wenxiniae TaxID=1737357 RepID=UPI003C1F89AC
MLIDNLALIAAGAALHWLQPRDKMPIEKHWSTAPRYTAEQLKSTYRRDANIGLRTGEPSKIGDYYLQVIDLDIRKPEMAAAAWAALLEVLPRARSLPCVISGSGGESRHFYTLSKAPLASKKLVRSPGFEMVFDPKKGREVRKHDWEIDLKANGTQVALPPSIHPDTGLPYRWERPLDLDFLELMLVEIQGATQANASSIEDDDDDLFSIVRADPLDLDEDEIERIIDDLPEDWVEDRDYWFRVGMAFHHQYRGEDEGFEAWCEWSSQSAKFDRKDSFRVWESFRGKNTPFTFRSLIQAAGANRFDEELDLDFDAGPSAAASDIDLSDLLGGSLPPVVPAKAEVIDEVDPDWKSRLHRNEEGELKSTLPNISLIVENDPRMTRVMQFNEFSQEIVLRGEPRQAKKKRESAHGPVNLDGPIWKVRDTLNGDNWTDSHDNAVRRLIETKSQMQGYGIKVTDRDLRGALDATALKHSFHPIKEMITSVTWDGKPRAETMWIDYLACEDTAYNRQASLLTLVGAVARIFRPGHKFDFVPILEGAQGKGKSTFIEILGLKWYGELTGDVGDPKQMIEVMQGKWILELGELSAMQRSEVNDLKAFVSRTHDKARLAWEKRAKEFARQCIFIGSTNDREYLRDPTGNRRFWPIVCMLPEGVLIDNRKFAGEVMQIWAEAVHIYHQMCKDYGHLDRLPLHMKGEGAAQAIEMQESRRVETVEEALAGEIIRWLNTPLDAEFDDLEPGMEPLMRQETCMTQIWREMMGRDGSIPHTESVKIGRAMQLVKWDRSHNVLRTAEINRKYGPCRVYSRPMGSED